MNMQTQIKDIYGRLQDELSIEIFENRLLYSLTEGAKYIGNIMELLYGSRDKWRPFHEYNNIVVYGVGNIAKDFKYIFELTDNITAFCDKDKNKQKTMFCGCKIVSPEELKEKYIDSVIVITLWKDKLIAEITEDLLKLGFSENQILIFKKEICKKDNRIIAGTQYFDTDAVPLLHRNDEIFIDAGCLDCTTSFDFVKWSGGKYKKIVAFEPNPKQYPACIENSKKVDNITVYPHGLWNEKAELSFENDGLGGGAHISSNSESTVKIKVVKLDDILNGEAATFIKMDIEGAELNALKGAEQTILKHRPKLAISVYHKPEDIWEIPAYILSLHKDYKFYLRHYSTSAVDTVLYAV